MGSPSEATYALFGITWVLLIPVCINLGFTADYHVKIYTVNIPLFFCMVLSIFQACVVALGISAVCFRHAPLMMCFCLLCGAQTVASTVCVTVLTGSLLELHRLYAAMESVNLKPEEASSESLPNRGLRHVINTLEATYDCCGWNGISDYETNNSVIQPPITCCKSNVSECISETSTSTDVFFADFGCKDVGPFGYWANVCHIVCITFECLALMLGIVLSRLAYQTAIKYSKEV
jgi:hypothetical protein